MSYLVPQMNFLGCGLISISLITGWNIVVVYLRLIFAYEFTRLYNLVGFFSLG